jgi:branched-chain amino acid transport system ATP-binding protein
MVEPTGKLLPLAQRNSVPSIELRGVSVSFGGVRALDAVDITVAPSAMTALIGPNGAGKTTLLAAASGLLRPHSGRVLVEGEDLTGRPPYVFAEHGLLRTFQQVGLFAELSVREHLSLGFRLSRRTHSVGRDLLGLGRGSRSDEIEKVTDVLERLDLTACANSLPNEIPLGTRRLVEVGQILVSDPKVILLDEPSAGLDNRETRGFAEVLRGTNTTDHIGFLIVEHDLEFVSDVCRDAYVLDAGRVIAVGAPSDVLDSDIVRLAYLGSGAQAP